MIDSLEAYTKTNLTYVYRGMIYFGKSEYSKALVEYNKALEKEEFPFALDQRAKVYIKQKKYDLALRDCQKAYEWNYDFSFQIASVFEIQGDKDSALKYYQIFLTHYPDKKEIQQKIKVLRSN